MMEIYDVKTENMGTPIGIDAVNPRLSWKLKCGRSNVVQKSYELFAYGDAEMANLLWDSGYTESEQSVAVKWQGPQLYSGQRVFWRVKIQATDGDGNLMEAVSSLTWFEMGILSEKDWIGRWIEPENEIDSSVNQPAPYLRKEFHVRHGLMSARIYHTAHGLYEFWVNGHLGCADKFKPGFTAYYDRLQYQVHDITGMLQEGSNVLAVILGDGWWRGYTGGAYRNNFGYKLAYLGQIHLVYEDGTEEWICSDESFRTAYGAYIYNDMKYGEIYDAGREPEIQTVHGNVPENQNITWKQPGYDMSHGGMNWKNVHLEKDGFAVYQNLIASRSVPVREKEEFIPIVMTAPNGKTLLDYGQNIAGYVKMHLRGLKKGQEISLHHGEALDENGNFTMKNLVIDEGASKMQTINYIAGNDDEAFYVPIFSVFGFRYVEISGYESEIKPEDFVAVAVYSDMGETGNFTCSNELINKLVNNSRWSMKGNFLDVPTDCPTRERSPWSGDAQIFAKTATELMDVFPFFEKWLEDLAAEQNGNGSVPITFPMSAAVHNPMEREKMLAVMDCLPEENIMKLVMRLTLGSKETGAYADNSAGWGDAAVIIPYTMYLCYGDKSVLEKQYPAAKKWVEYMRGEAAKKSERYSDKPWYDNGNDGKYVWDRGFHFGEWCEPGISEDTAGNYKRLLENPDYTTATMYYYYSSFLLARMADILGKTEDREFYRDIALKVKKIFNKYFITKDGEILEEPEAVLVYPDGGRQAPYVRTLAFHLADELKEKLVLAKLVDRVRANGYRLNTGFLSTPYLLPVLAEGGYLDVAYKLLENEEAPGWLYNVKRGATTILENWDGYEKCKASFNHYSYGSVCDFLFSYVAGIMPVIDKPGYKHFTIKPMPGGSLSYARASYICSYGEIVSAWEKQGDRILYEIKIPENTTAIVVLPGEEVQQVGSGLWKFEQRLFGGESVNENHRKHDIRGDL